MQVPVHLNTKFYFVFSWLSVYMLFLLHPTAPNKRAICLALLIFALVFMWMHLTCTDDTNHCYMSGRDLYGKQDFYTQKERDAFISTQNNHTYCTTTSNDRPSSSRGRDAGKLALMRRADGLYIAFQWLKSFYWSIKRQLRANVVFSLAHDHQLRGKYLSFMLMRERTRETTLHKCIPISQLSTHHQFLLPLEQNEQINILIILAPGVQEIFQHQMRGGGIEQSKYKKV